MRNHPHLPQAAETGRVGDALVRACDIADGTGSPRQASDFSNSAIIRAQAFSACAAS